ncbi:hypothetical protein ACLKMY_40335 [Paraburkholderia mimosarum]|uniref:hypothetical protein n=1 Tax=Paraburkholderia mimosarum TaxID=312026 RepID=UPI0012B54075|nr:hypothetical protein [Paraburkholderia mimosarum]
MKRITSMRVDVRYPENFPLKGWDKAMFGIRVSRMFRQGWISICDLDECRESLGLGEADKKARALIFRSCTAAISRNCRWKKVMWRCGGFFANPGRASGRGPVHDGRMRGSEGPHGQTGAAQLTTVIRLRREAHPRWSPYVIPLIALQYLQHCPMCDKC